MKKNLTTILISITFLAGLSLLLYPLAANEWNNYRQSRLIASYEEAIIGNADATATISYEKEWEKADIYNEEMLPATLPDSFAMAEASEGPDEEYISCLNLMGDGMMGYIEIPKIRVSIPLYHTTTDDVLQKGAGHLEGSSLPVGGESTHSVISAHRGLPSATLFTDLDQLEKGNHFILHIMDEKLCYEVDEMNVVEPDQTELLSVEDGQDLVTLLTCTPYGVNSHRLLVRGHRVPYMEVEDEEMPAGMVSLHTNYLLWVIVGLSVTGAFIILLYFFERRTKRVVQEDNAQEADDQTKEIL